MKRKDVLETELLNENPLIAALMGALIGAGVERNRARQAAQTAAADPAVAQAAGGAPAASPRPQARPAAGPSGTLRRGSTGPQVAALQRRLGVEETGTFDDATEAAVRAFQQQAGIQVDGVVGRQTQAAFSSGGAPRNAGNIGRGAADFDYSAGQRPAPQPAAEPTPDQRDAERERAAQIAPAQPGPTADQRDAERERAAAQAPNNGAPQANPNRTAGAPSRLQIRQRIAPEMERLLQLASKDFRGYTAIMEGKGLAEALEPPQKAQLQQLLNQVRAAAQNDPQVNTEFADLIARAQRALGVGTTNPNDTTGQPDLSPDGPNAATPDIGPLGAGPTFDQNAARNASANANQAAADAAMGDRGAQPTGPNVPQNLRFATRQAAQRALGPNVSRAINSNGRPINGTTTIMIGNEYFAVPRATGTAPGQPAQVAATQPQTVSEGKAMKKTINEASVNINGTAEEIAELMRMMQLSGAPNAKPVDADDINPGPKPCPICGKIHGPMPKPGGCGGAPMQGPKEPDMGDMIRMMSVDEENDDGGFGDATTEPSDTYMASNAGDVSDVIPDGNDLHKEKGSYPATAGGDNPMSIKEALWKALNEKKKKAKPDFLDVDGDGDKTEPMKKALKDKKKK